MERGALLSMMSLASSDLLFCLVTLSGSNLPATKLIYEEKDFSFYYTLYANCVQNILIKTSTWFTVILAIGRYFVVCHPITARNYLRCKHTLAALLLGMALWICAHIPLLYQWHVKHIHCPRKSMYMLSAGVYENNHKLKLACTYSWFAIGFVKPVCILGYCNIRLIYSLRVSNRLRSGLTAHSGDGSSTSSTSSCRRPLRSSSTMGKPSGNPTGNTSQRRLTSTLIAIVILFFVCFFPSEVIQFYADLKKPQYKGWFRFMLDFCSLLQAINFSGNFVLYCVVNAYFRSTLQQWLQCLSLGCGKPLSGSQLLPLRDRISRKQSKMSLTTKHSIVSLSG